MQRLAMCWSDWDSLREWLEERALLEPGTTKPARPKEAMQAVMHHRRLPRSAARFRKLAENVGHAGCRDPAFGKLSDALRAWFGSEGQAGGDDLAGGEKGARRQTR